MIAGVKASDSCIHCVERGGNIHQDASAVICNDFETRYIAFVGIGCPGNIYPASALFGVDAAGNVVLAVGSVNADTIAAGNEANYLVAGNGSAATGKLDKAGINALDQYPLNCYNAV